MEKRMTEDFLWFSYFGITKTDAEKDNNAALKACIARAYQDVCRRIEYYYSSSKLQNEFKEYKDSFGKLKGCFLSNDCTIGNSAICLLCSHITLLLNEVACEKNAFNAWHSTTCDCLVSFANNYASRDHFLLKKDKDKKDSFKYGLAQKWVNLSLKNMIVMGLWSKLESFEPFLHVTIDSYIYKAIADPNTKNDFAFKKPIVPIEHNDDKEGSLGYFIDTERKGKTQPWSKLNKADYTRLQEDINRELQKNNEEKISGLSPFYWEWHAWIEQAKLEKTVLVDD